MVRNVLAVDFDYFFESVDIPDDGWDLYDWGHRESRLFIEFMWKQRAADFLRAGLPLPGLVAGPAWATPDGFWDRVRLTDDAVVWCGESNAQALSVPGIAGAEQVWLFDAHHDTGYTKTAEQAILLADGADDSESVWTCENWMVPMYGNGAELHVRYPTWRQRAFDLEPAPVVPVDRAFDDGTVPPVEFDTVFVCRSGAWVPAWLDDHFVEFVNRAPAEQIDVIDGAYDPLEPREFDPQAAQALAAQQDEAITATGGPA